MEEKARILIVDDTKENRLMLTLALKNENYEFIEAKNGKDALKKALKYNPDIILLDAIMPEMDGFEFTRKIREIEQFKRTPILMITSLNEKADKHKAIKSGVNDFISKPFDMEELKLRCRSYANLAKINKNYILATIDKDTKLPNKLALLQELKKCNNQLLIMFRIKDYEIFQEFYGVDLALKVKIAFAREIPRFLPGIFKNAVLYHTNEEEFALLIKDKIEKNIFYQNLFYICKEFYEKIHNTPIKVDGYEYNLNITLSFSKKGFEYARGALNYAVKNNISVVEADKIIENLKEDAKKNIKTLNLIKKALNSNEVVSFYQPIYNNKTKKVEKYESLVRIIDNDKVISPFFFLDVAKRSNYYLKITERVLENSFKAIEKHNKEISINLSFLDIQNKEIRKKIINYLFKNPEIAKKVTFEILEDEGIKNFEIVKEFIKEVINYNVKIAIDDFGAGYSNFERVLELKPDFLKIDGSLIKNIETNDQQKTVVETIQNFAKEIGIKTVAEFVSNEKIFNIINEIGVDYTQGYFISEPRANIGENND
jgi:EAL domain-containing protein (putative c-di-GMP-specific phosphodiesterase class I)/CheY-like chemotaxis protein